MVCGVDYFIYLSTLHILLEACSSFRLSFCLLLWRHFVYNTYHLYIRLSFLHLVPFPDPHVHMLVGGTITPQIVFSLFSDHTEKMVMSKSTSLTYYTSVYMCVSS